MIMHSTKKLFKTKSTKLLFLIFISLIFLSCSSDSASGGDKTGDTDIEKVFIDKELIPDGDSSSEVDSTFEDTNNDQDSFVDVDYPPRTVDCTNTKPDSSLWDAANSGGKIKQTFDGSAYMPASDSCKWSCSPGFHEDSGKCLSDKPKSGEWRPMPIRTEWEFNNHRYGGEGEQLFHGIARSLNNPDYIYLNEDVDGSWRSSDGGKSWKKALDRGLKCPNGFSIEVDPVNPNLVFSLQDGDNEYYTFEYANKGLYRSENGGDDWERVLHVETNIEWAFHRGYRHNIAYDPASMDETSAKRWYLAIQSGEFTKDEDKMTDGDSDYLWTDGGIYISEDRGLTWTQQSHLPGHDKINGIYPHPTDGKTLYIASKNGLYVSYDKGGTIEKLGDLPAYAVRSIAVHPTTPDIIYVGLADTHYYVGGPGGKKIYNGPWGQDVGLWEQSAGIGVYKSTNKGENFTSMVSPEGMNLFMNPGHPEYMYLLTYGNGTGWTSSDGGESWDKFKLNPDSYVMKNETTGEDRTRGFAGEQSGLAPNPDDPNDVVGFGSGSIQRSVDGGKTFSSSRTGFTGFAAAWYSTSFIYDQFNPNWLGLSLLDTTMVKTETAGAFFESANVKTVHQWYYDDKFTAPRSDKDSTMADMRLIPWFGSVAGALQPVKGSDIIVAAVGKYFDNYLMRSQDRGKSWTLYDETVFSSTIDDYKMRARLYNFIGFDKNSTDTVYAGDKVSLDTGITWSNLPVPEDSKTINVIGLSYDSGGTWVYAEGNYLSNIYRARPPVKEWETVISSKSSSWQFRGIDRKPVMIVNPGDPSMLLVPGDDDHDGSGRRDLVIIKDGVPKYTGLIDQVTGSGEGTFMAAAAVDPSNSDVIYAAFSSQGLPTIFRSTDGGETWENIDKNRPRAGGCTLSVHPVTGELFVGSTIGTWILPPPYESNTPNYDRQYYPGVEFTSTVASTVPNGLGGKGLTESSIELIWNSSIHEQGGIMYYTILRNDKVVGKSYNTKFVDSGEDLENGLDELKSYSYKVIAVSRAGVESAKSADLTVKTIADTVSPKVEKILDTSSKTKIVVVFDEPLQATSAENAASYSLSPSVIVQSASLGADKKTVTLTTEAMSANDYKLTVSGVVDASSNNNKITTAQISFKNYYSFYPDSPMSYWSFDGNVNDASGTNNGTWKDGASSYGAGWIGQGIILDGKDKGAHVNVPDHSSQSGMEKLSFSIWAKKDVTAVGGRLFEKHTSYKLDVNEDSVSGYFFTQNGTVRVDFNTAVPSVKDTEWHHYSLVYDSDASSLTLYVDGAQVSSDTQTGVVPGAEGKALSIGKDPWGNAFAGAIDEMKIFKSVLTANQVKALSLERE